MIYTDTVSTIRPTIMDHFFVRFDTFDKVIMTSDDCECICTYGSVRPAALDTSLHQGTEDSGQS